MTIGLRARTVRYGTAALMPGLGLGVLAILVTLFLPSLFLSRVSFAPDTPARGGLNAGGLNALIGQIGLGMLTGGSQSLAFYSELARSRGVLENVVNRPMPDSLGVKAATLALLWYPNAKSVEWRTYRAVRRLDKRLTVIADERAGIVSVAVLAESPPLAQWLSAAIYDELNRYNLSVRGSRAKEERVFTEGRLAEARDSLTAAEAALKAFYRKNRVFQDSPDLTFEERELKRRVDGQLELYTTLQRQVENARLDEVRDTPVLNLIERATRPVLKAWPLRGRLAVLFALIGSLIGVLVEFGAPWSERLVARIRGRPTPVLRPVPRAAATVSPLRERVGDE